jgi:N-acetylmuramoyl-L-alanine amidase
MVNRFLLFLIFISFLNGNILYNAWIDGDRLSLEFKRAPKGIKFSTLKRDVIKYIFDFDNTNIKSQTKINRNLKYSYPVKAIKISQLNSKTARVVIEAATSYSPKLYKSDRIYQITLPTQSKPLSSIGDKVKSLFSSIGSSSSSFSIPMTTKKRYTVILDPGHGGKDVGAVSHSKREKDAVLQIALRVKMYLEKKGFKVLMTRSRDYFVKLPNRTQFANRKKGDLFVSIHANSIKGSRRKKERVKGVETYYLSPARSKRAKMVAAKENSVEFEKKYKESMSLFLNTLTRSKIILSHKLAMDIQSRVIKNLRAKYRGVVDGGVKPAPFWVLVGAEMPAILIETGYISNSLERKRLFNRYYQDRLAKGIAEGIVRFLRNREKELE